MLLFTMGANNSGWYCIYSQMFCCNWPSSVLGPHHALNQTLSSVKIANNYNEVSVHSQKISMGPQNRGQIYFCFPFLTIFSAISSKVFLADWNSQHLKKKKNVVTEVINMWKDKDVLLLWFLFYFWLVGADHVFTSVTWLKVVHLENELFFQRWQDLQF